MWFGGGVDNFAVLGILLSYSISLLFDILLHEIIST